MVYQFSLAPLVLHTFYTGDCRVLTEWADSLKVPFPGVTFFNFIASHDGIGVRPAEGLLTQDEIQALADRVFEHGGQVSYKTNTDGSKSAYELNITLFDALNNPRDPSPAMDVRRFLASQAIMLSIAGVPGIYIHSLFGSRNCYTCFEKTGRARSINREKFQLTTLEAMLSDPETLTFQVFSGYKQMLRARREHSAFHPHGSQQVFTIGSEAFAVLRTSPNGDGNVLCLVNVTQKHVTIDITQITSVLGHQQKWIDLITGKTFETHGAHSQVSMEGYQYLWLTSKCT